MTPKRNTGLMLDPALIAEIRGALEATAGIPGAPRDLSDFAEKALIEYLMKWRLNVTDGKPFELVWDSRRGPRRRAVDILARHGVDEGMTKAETIAFIEQHGESMSVRELAAFNRAWKEHGGQ